MLEAIQKWFNRGKIKQDNQWSFIGVLVGGIAALLASFVLSIQALDLAGNPEVTFSCDVNSAVSCGAVALHPTASLLGFPNSYLGMMAEPVVITIAVALLAGVVFPRWFMASFQGGMVLGLVFAFYLLFTSVFVIQSLCLWCLLLIMSTILMFFSLLRYNIREKNLYFKPKCQKKAEAFIKGNYDRFIMVLLMVGVLGLIVFKYGADLFV